MSLLPLVNRLLRTAEIRGSAIAAGRAWHGTADGWTFDDNGAIDSDGNMRRRYRLGSLGALHTPRCLGWPRDLGSVFANFGLPLPSFSSQRLIYLSWRPRKFNHLDAGWCEECDCVRRVVTTVGPLKWGLSATASFERVPDASGLENPKGAKYPISFAEYGTSL